MWRYGLILLLASKVYSQPITFSKTIDFKSGLEFPTSVIEMDSGYVIRGSGIDFQSIGGWVGSLFIKTDFNGDTISSGFYGKEKVHQYAGWIGSFIKTSDDKYAVGVSEFDSVRSNLKAMLIRYNENGDTLFVKRYGGVADDLANQVIETSDRGFALIGKTTSFGIAFYLVKTDSLGNFQWQKTYANSSDSRGLSIALAYDGGFIISGWREMPGLNREPVIVKTDSSGNEQWQKKYGTRNEDGGIYLNRSSDSSYIVWGSIDTFNLTTISGQKLWSHFVMKIDHTGEVIWRHITNSNWYQQITMVREIEPGKGFIAAGGTYDSVYGAWNDYGWLLRLDNDGNILWERKYAYPRQIGNNGLAFSTLYDVQLTKDGGFICLGNTTNVNQDFWLLKLDSLGCMGDYCGLTDTNCYYKPYPNCADDTVGVGEMASIKYQDLRLRVYPNPAKDVVYFHPTSKYAAIEQITVYDAQGRMVIQKKYAGSLNIEHLPAGIYYYEAVIDDMMLPSQNERPVRGKIIKQ